MKSETQIKIGRITALILFFIPILAIFVVLIGGLLSTFPLFPQPNFLHHLGGGFGIGFVAGCLPALILLYCFISAIGETKFVKGLLFFLLYCGLVIGVGIFIRTNVLGWSLTIAVCLLLLQGVIGLYKAQKANLKKPKDEQKQ
jgi:hypothetical protein